MIEDAVVGIIIGMVIGSLAFLMKRYRDVTQSEKRIKKNNVGKFSFDGKEKKGEEEEENKEEVKKEIKTEEKNE